MRKQAGCSDVCPRCSRLCQRASSAVWRPVPCCTVQPRVALPNAPALLCVLRGLAHSNDCLRVLLRMEAVGTCTCSVAVASSIPVLTLQYACVFVTVNPRFWQLGLVPVRVWFAWFLRQRVLHYLIAQGIAVEAAKQPAFGLPYIQHSCCGTCYHVRWRVRMLHAWLPFTDFIVQAQYCAIFPAGVRRAHW